MSTTPQSQSLSSEDQLRAIRALNAHIDSGERDRIAAFDEPKQIIFVPDADVVFVYWLSDDAATARSKAGSFVPVSENEVLRVQSYDFRTTRPTLH